MIPKIIHYCWLSGDPYPPKIQYCLDSWKRQLPDYEVRLWDLNRFDINSSRWCKEAFSRKKYAFVADYIRNYALFHEGGIYLDSDVEVVKPFDPLLGLPYFIGRERSGAFEPAIMGAEPGLPFYKKMLDYYSDRAFIVDGEMDMRPLPEIMGEIIAEDYSIIDINKIEEFNPGDGSFNLFPADYFSPKRNDTFKIEATENTYSIHHFNASWFPPQKKVFRVISRLLGYKTAVALSSFLKSFSKGKK